MKYNIGKIDRLLRIILAGLLFLAFLKATSMGVCMISALVVSGVLMVTAIIGISPFYSALGWNSKEIENN